MVAFRKIFPVLAIVALLLGTALTANAQAVVAPTSAPVCTANAGVPPIVRSEGLTELMGDLVLICQGGRAGQTFLVNFQIFLNTNITSRIIGTSGTADTTSIFGQPLSRGGGDVTEALLIVDEAGSSNVATPFCVSPSANNNPTGPFTGTGSTPAQQAGASCNPAAVGATFQTGTYTVFRAQRAVGTQNALIWAGVPVVAPGTPGVTRTFRFTNIRANASQVGVSDTLIPSQIVAYIAVNPPGSISIDNPQQVVGFVQRGLRFDTRNCANDDGLGSTGVQLQQCSSLNAGKLPGDSQTGTGLLRFRENFPAAFKYRIDPAQSAGNMAPGTVFLASESGFVRTELGDAVGVATNGTRLAVRFNNIPAGVRLFVGTRSVGSGVQPQAVLVAAGGTGESVTLAPGRTFVNPQELAPSGSGSITCGGSSAGAFELTPVGGSAIAIYEIVYQTQTTGTGSTAVESFAFPRGDVIDTVLIPFAINFSSNLSAATPTPALGTATVTGSFAPFYAATNTAAGQASSGLPIPRFVDQGINSTIFRINQCVTNLLFPYVTNWAGFDTGIAISNTSNDPFGSNSQSGNCTINYYGRLQNGNAPTTTRETTDRAVAGGEHLTFILSGGGTNGLKGNPGFQGYIIAQCGFQYAHGFAFITDGPIGAARVAEGYLAIVLDAPGLNRTGQTGESQAH